MKFYIEIKSVEGLKAEEKKLVEFKRKIL